MELVLAKIQLDDEVKRVKGERKRVEERMRRLREVYLEGDLPRDQYGERKRSLEVQLASLVIPDVDAAQEAGRLLEGLAALWQEADLRERCRLLRAMLEAVYVDPVEERAIVALQLKPSFRALFQIATTRAGSGVILYKENPPGPFTGPEDDSPLPAREVYLEGDLPRDQYGERKRSLEVQLASLVIPDVDVAGKGTTPDRSNTGVSYYLESTTL